MEPDGLQGEVAAIQKASSLEAVRTIAWPALRSAHVIGVVYHHVPPMGHRDLETVQVTAKRFSEELVERYVTRQHYRQNSVLLRALSSTHARIGSAQGLLNTDDPEAQAFFREVLELAPNDWLTVPVFGPSSRNGAFGLIFEAAPPPLDHALIQRLEMFCQAIHLRV